MSISTFPAWEVQEAGHVTGQQIKMYLGEGEPDLFVLHNCSWVRVLLSDDTKIPATSENE